MLPHGHDPDDHHVHCLDVYSLHSSAEEPRSNHRTGPFDVLCRIPVDKSHGKLVTASLTLCPGIDVLDFYETSERSDIWKNGVVTQCLMPPEVIGWEFYSLLWPKPAGCSPLYIMESVELLVGRQPGATVCPSVVFAFIPKGHSYEVVSQATAARQRQGQQPSAPSQGGNASHGQPSTRGVRTAAMMERHCGNIDAQGKSMTARLVALFPNLMYKDGKALPDDPNWGLFIGPRSRTLVLLNKQRGRIDLSLAILMGVDAAFRKSNALVEATAKLFEPFGTHEHVPALFGDLDPLKIHSGFTNAVHADHCDVTIDGRSDYLSMFEARCPTFFVSNSSGNLCYLTPQEAVRHRHGDNDASSVFANDYKSPVPKPLPDMPCWTTHLGKVGMDAQKTLQSYRVRVPVRSAFFPTTGTDTWFSSLSGYGKWFASMGACSTVTKASETPGSGQHLTPAPSVAAPADVTSLGRPREGAGQDQARGASHVHWRDEVGAAPPTFGVLPPSGRTPPASGMRDL